MIAQGLFAYLANVPELISFVGSNPTRIFPHHIPQHDYTETTKQPCLVYQLPGSFRQALFCRTDDVVQQSVQIDCYAPLYLDARNLARAARRALVDYGGLMGSVTVRKVLIDNEFEGLDENPGLLRVTQLYSVWFVET